jgi:hypothetical protein
MKNDDLLKHFTRPCADWPNITLSPDLDAHIAKCVSQVLRFDPSDGKPRYEKKLVVAFFTSAYRELAAFNRPRTGDPPSEVCACAL